MAISFLLSYLIPHFFPAVQINFLIPSDLLLLCGGSSRLRTRNEVSSLNENES